MTLLSTFYHHLVLKQNHEKEEFSYCSQVLLKQVTIFRSTEY